MSHRALETIYKANSPALCMLCWNNPKKSVMSAVVKTNNYNPGNCISHIKHCHTAEEAPLIFADIGKKSEASSEVHETSENPRAKSLFQKMNKKGSTECLQFLVYKFITVNGLPARLARSPELSEILCFTIENSPNLQKLQENDLRLSQFKFEKIQVKQFNATITTIKFIVDSNQEFFKDIFGRTVPFLTIAHDIWDSKDYQILGVSLFLICSKTGMRLQMPIGLLRARGKSAQDIARETLSICQRCGITQQDIFRVVSDTAATARCASRLMESSEFPRTYEGTSCTMHSVELIMKHALGRVPRKKNYCRLFSCCRSVAAEGVEYNSNIIQQEKKHLWMEYSKVGEEKYGEKPNKIDAPNETRISGTFLMYRNVLRSKYLLDYFLRYKEQDNNKICDMLTHNEWVMLAENN